MSVTILHGDCREILRTLPAESVHMVCTSPPYFGLRDYGVAGQIGLEPTPDEYIAELVAVLREVRRVLRKDGTVWLNLGDSYARAGGEQGGGNRELLHMDGKQRRMTTLAADCKAKDLLMIPARVALALQADGWLLRSEIAWVKPNPMPESVTDRPTSAHEKVYLFAKCRWAGDEPKQFAHIADDDARWLALFLDTEGNICVKRAQGPGGTIHYGAQVAIGNTHRGLVERAQEIIGRGAVCQRKGKSAPMFYFQMSNRQAADLLHRVYPFLIVKQRQARLAIHLQNILADAEKERRSKEGQLRGRGRSDGYSAELDRIWQTMKAINHFATPDLSWVPELSFGKWVPERYYFDADAVREPHVREWEANNGGTFGPVTSEGGKQRALGGTKDHKGEYPLPNPLGRNIRNVWTIATSPYPEAHFATFPPELAKRCIKAGTSERGCCPECGAPWVRVLERVSFGKADSATKYVNGEQADRLSGSRQAYRAQGLEGPPPPKTLRWDPSCKCHLPNTIDAVPYTPKPCTVLDPFGGAGTVGLVADRLQRNAILIELNREYVTMAENRIRNDAPLFALCLPGEA